MLLKERKEYNQYAPVPFWSWNNRLDKTEIEKQIRRLYEGKYGGFVIHARAGLDTPYMGEEWFACVETALVSAKALRMKVWLYDEFGFPSGLAGGINLQDETKRAQYLEYKEERAFPQEAFAVFVEENGAYRRVEKDIGDTSYHCVYLRTSETEVDVCNPAVAQNLLTATHERYYARFKAYFGDTVEGFFSDGPQYYRYATPYTKELEKEYSGDIRDGLIWLFKQDERGYAFRVQYYALLNKLYTRNYYKTIYDWCEAHGCKLTGHTVEEPHLFTQMWCCGGAMPSYEFCQVPGIDHKDFPEYIFGEKRERAKIEANCSLQTIVENQPHKVRYLQGNKVVSRHCKGEIGEYIYIVNFDENDSAEIVFDGMEEFVEYDILQEKAYAIEKTIRLKPCQSAVLKKGTSKVAKAKIAKEEDVTKAFLFKARTENTLMLDFVRFSKDGRRFSDTTFYSQMLDELLFENYAGELYVRYYFQTETAGDYTLTTGNTRMKGVNFDGKKIKLVQSDYDITYREAALKSVQKGEHYIEFLI